MDITNEDFDEEFCLFSGGINDDDCYDTLRHLCQQYHLDAGSIATEWLAFAHTHKHKKITTEFLDHMERERLIKKRGDKTPKSAKTPSVKPKLFLENLEGIINVEDDISDAYATPNGKLPIKRQHTPDTPMNKRIAHLTNQEGSPSLPAPFSPSSLSPASSGSSKAYSNRTNAGETIFSYGDSSSISWKTKREDVDIINLHKDSALVSQFKYMFQKLTDKAMILNDWIECISDYLQKENAVPDIAHVGLPAQEAVTVCGRIGCDSQGKLNAQSIILEGSQDSSAAQQIPLDVSELKQYSLFPGQIAMFDGINSTGAKMVASKMYSAGLPPRSLSDSGTHGGDLHMVVACGPFTASDSLTYEPLADLIKALQREPPDVAILLGPFIDAKNLEVEKGNLSMTYEDFFARTIEQITSALANLPTRVVLVPSQRDVHHECVYPQPPFSMTSMASKRVHLVSDPCMVSIDGIVCGITSTDIIFQLGLEEISVQPPGAPDRLTRLTQHLLTQRSFYPLYPPAEHVNMDFDHFEVYGHMQVCPDILIIPSDLRQFIKDVQGCVCVNPGRLAKGQVGGSYARLKIPGQTRSNSATGCVGKVLRI